MSNPLQLNRVRDVVRKRAALFMTSSCTISRVASPVLDINTGNATSGTATPVYTGVCRVWEITGNAITVVGEDEITEQSTNLSIPWNTSPVPIKGDYVKITASATDSHLVGRTYVITEQAKSGEIRPTRRFAIKGVQERTDDQFA